MKLRIAVAVVHYRGSLLVGVRPENATFAGMCEFPGGKIEPGESPAGAARRECEEETGIAVEVVDEYPPAVSAVDGQTLEIQFFRCRPLSCGEPLAPFQWTAAVEIDAEKFPPANQALIAQLAADLND